jgi:hypothetical protein
VASESFTVKCCYCGRFSIVLGVTAKQHYVSEWPKV